MAWRMAARDDREVGMVATITPANFHARDAKDLGEVLCIHEDPSAPVGLRRVVPRCGR